MQMSIRVLGHSIYSFLKMVRTKQNHMNGILMALRIFRIRQNDIYTNSTVSQKVHFELCLNEKV